jgi:KRAB domain-containing zinc finger protein
MDSDLEVRKISNKYEFKKIKSKIFQKCRACLTVKKRKQLIYLFDENEAIEPASILSYLVDIEISPWDNLPHYICDVCLSKLEDAYEIVKQCEKSDQELRNADLRLEEPQEQIYLEIETDEKEENLEKETLDNPVELEEDPEQAEIQDTEEMIANQNLVETPIISEETSKIIDSNIEIQKLNRPIKRLLAREDQIVKKPKLDNVKDEVETISTIMRIYSIESEKRDQKRTMYQCTHCSKSFPQEFILRHHKKIFHAFPDRFKCAECHHTFPSEDALLRHEQDENCRETRVYSCHDCSMKFTTKSNLLAHKRIVHSFSSQESYTILLR